MDWGKFFSMGGYAFYVWGSYGVTLLLLAGEVFMLWRRKRNLARRSTAVDTQAQTQLDASLQGIP